MMRGLCAILCVVAGAAWPFGAVAQSGSQTLAPGAAPNAVAGLEALARTPFYRQLVVHALASIPPEVFKPCPTMVTRGSRIAILTPVAIAKDGFPTAGLWKQTFPVTGCGPAITLNVYFAATPAEKINSLVAAPGDTRANPVLQADALAFAKTTLTSAQAGCATLDVRDTRFVAYGLGSAATPDPGVDQPDRPWRETWTLVGCGRTFHLALGFAPGPKGTRVVQPDSVSGQ